MWKIKGSRTCVRLTRRFHVVSRLKAAALRVPTEPPVSCPQRNPGYVRPGLLCLSGRDLNPICQRLGQGRPPRRLRSNIALHRFTRPTLTKIKGLDENFVAPFSG